MKKVLSVLAVAASLAACGGGGGDSKDLFSVWTRDSTNATLDLSASQFGPDNHLNAYTTDGTRCICDLAIIGDQGSGSIAITGCISIPYNASRNPQCVALQGTGNYTKNDGTLTIMRNGQSSTFH